MEHSNPNLSTDFVQDMLAESPAKEPMAVVADRIISHLDRYLKINNSILIIKPYNS